MHSPRKVKPIVSSHKKRTAPKKTTSKHLSDLTTKGPFPKNKLSDLTRKGPLQAKQTAVSSHKKGTAPSKTNCGVISLERDSSLKNKQRPQSKLSQQITKCEWIFGTLSQHVAWLCDSRFLSQGGSVSPQAWSISALKGYSNIFLIALETRPVLHNRR